MSATSDLPTAWGGRLGTVLIRREPEDFIVEEQLGFEPSGTGEHAFLCIEKRGANTEWVAKQLARFCGVGPVAVGFAGLKDRHAVTRQYFTVHLPGKADPDWSAFAHAEYRVISATRHQRKLPRGALRGNRFALILREFDGDPEAFAARLTTIARAGVPNYFGEQRFGREAGNVAAAMAMFAGRRVERSERGILLSAARSHVFNAVLARRVAEGTWCQALLGEVFQLDGTGSIFGPEPLSETLQARLDALDIHPTGPMWGAGESRVREAVAELENAVASEHADLCAGLAAADLRPERRATRLRVQAPESRRMDDGAIALSFSLGVGAYATAVLAELVDTREPSR